MVSVIEESWDFPGGSSGTGKVLTWLYTVSKVLAPLCAETLVMVAFWTKLKLILGENIRVEKTPTGMCFNIQT